jgi:hypothetical protein
MWGMRGACRRAAALPWRASGAGRASARARLHAPQQAAQEAAQAGARGRRERAVQQQAEARAAGRVGRPAGLANACPRARPRVKQSPQPRTVGTATGDSNPGRITPAQGIQALYWAPLGDTHCPKAR